ncbi:MAG: hypothetical protein AAFU49_24085, partial [Pseudomonadota bacterium]
MRTIIPLLLLSTTACTYGKVTWGGDPVVGSDVRFEDCDGNVWETTTNSQGWFEIDGHLAGVEPVAEETVLMSA